MKIAYILPVNMQRFGYTKENYLKTHFSVAIAREVAKLGYDVSIHTFWDKEFTYREKNMTIYFHPLSLKFLFGEDFAVISIQLLKFNFLKDTIIHFHEPNRLFFIPFKLTNKKSKIITEHHGSGLVNPFPIYSIFYPIYSVLKGTLFRYLLSKCNTHIVHNTQALESMISNGVKKENILLSPNGINISKYHTYDKSVIKKKLGLGNETIIFFAGRICVAKGIKELVYAFESIEKEYKTVKLILAGPLQEKNLKKLIAKYWIGFKNSEELQKWFNVSDIFCLPSRGGEGFPITLIEALYYNLPIIATDVPGVKEWIPNKNITIVKKNNLDNLKKAILNTLNNKKRNSNSRKFVVNNYTWSKVCQKYIHVYIATWNKV